MGYSHIRVSIYGDIHNFSNCAAYGSSNNYYKMYAMQWLMWKIELICLGCLYAQSQNCSSSISKFLEGGEKDREGVVKG